MTIFKWAAGEKGTRCCAELKEFDLSYWKFVMLRLKHNYLSAGLIQKTERIVLMAAKVIIIAENGDSMKSSEALIEKE